MWKYRRAYEKPTGTGMKYRAIDGRLFDISQSTTTQVDGWTTGWTTAGPLYGIRNGKLYYIASASKVTQIGTEEGWTQISDHSTGSYNQHTYAIREGRLYAISKGEAFEIGASIPGKVIKILVKEGDVVAENDPLIVIEAMKMETNIVSKVSGEIKSIEVKENDIVEDKQLLITIK